MNRILIGLLLLFTFLGCENNEIDSLRNVPDNKELLPDRVFSLVENYINCGKYWPFENYNNFDVDIRVTRAYCSKDSSKYIFIITYQANGLKNRAYPEVNFEIGAMPFIAYKEGEDWIVYDYDHNVAIGFTSYKILEKAFIEWIDGPNYKNKTYVYYPNGKSKPIGYNPNDERFWNSQLWKKNIEIKDKYPFEIIRYQHHTELLKSVNELVLNCSQ